MKLSALRVPFLTQRGAAMGTPASVARAPRDHRCRAATRETARAGGQPASLPFPLPPDPSATVRVPVSYEKTAMCSLTNPVPFWMIARQEREGARGPSILLAVTVPLAVGTGEVIIVIAIAVVLVVLFVTLSLRQRRNAKARRDLVEAHERAARAERDLEIAQEHAHPRIDPDQ
jgi:hypothetical protein